MERYLDNLEKRLVESGYAYGVLTVGSSGGMMTVETARRLPIRTIYSGPAGGVAQACFVARPAGVNAFITYDMGGTSTDVCLVRDGRPASSTDNLIGAFPVKVPQLDLRSVGAGGGSVAWLDVDGALHVGPLSAGARPGPAAYGAGGTEPTVTDANVVLGRMSTTRKLGGSLRIRLDLAAAAVGALAARVGLSPEEMAEGILRIAVARMTASIREISIERGHDPREFALIAFGGAGPMHAIPVAAELGIPRIIVPRHPGNFSALGLLVSDIKHDDVRTRVGPLADAAGALAAAFAEMEAAAHAQLEREGFAPHARRIERFVDARYVGQAFELRVPAARTPPEVAALARDFHRQHLAVYGHADPAGAVELVNVRISAYGLVDKFTLGVVREALSSIVREMRLTLMRTAYSSILYEGEDFSCVLMDRQAQIVAMSRGQDHPLHIVPIAWSMKAVRDKFGDDIHPGDIFLHNDPYTGGIHLNDVAMIYPMFVDGELFLFPAVRAHWGDVGGASPGSVGGQVTEIYQEGVRIPPIRVCDRGRLDHAVLDLIFSNVRGPQEREGDFRAMVGTCRKAAERVEALVGRYGKPTLASCIGELLDRAERRMRRQIAQLPAGEYVYEAYLEGGRERLEPLRVRAAVRIAGDAITVDLSGSSPQTAGPTNVGPAMAPTGAFTILKAFLDPGGDINSGAFRPLTVIAPEGSLVNARRPAPCGGMVEVKYCVESAVMGALSQAIAGQVTGDLKGGGNHCYISGPDDRGGTFIFYEYPAAGPGAWDGGDGNNAVRAFTESDITTLQPVEAVEQKYPLRVERCALRPGSGGPGRWRGGLGLVREVRVIGPAAQRSVLAEKSLLRPYGVCGGFSGAPNRFYVRRDGADVEPSPLPGKVSGFPLRRGDVVVMETSGGGGYGDPFERDPAAVAADVAQGLVGRGTAADVYGVVFAGEAVDAAATSARRRTGRTARVWTTLQPDARLEGRRCSR